ncbi:hypothetical protein PoB_001120400 [Plakobranchus ocellatus]|uniref:Uncharacterized protein n=1 Tax=Plakobranchus ocellatus TaxID=259542 RepID=A0AAV3YRW1_9GAST|nr:hypothetical protein PoB_001120400 [Plakobranchus ocellatus]
MLERLIPTFSAIWAGSFAARKTRRAFSAIALNQGHEQCSALLKGERGVVALISNPSAPRRWMFAGPWGVGSTVASESALRSAGTLLSRVRALPPAPWPDG